MKREKRAGLGAEIRMADGGDGREFFARIIRYNVLDDYQSLWTPGVFTESLATRMPVVAWCHQWIEPIGRYVEVTRDDDVTTELLGRLDNFDDVPRARQAASQFRSGTLTDFSVGFTRQDWIRQQDLSPEDLALGACERITRALLDEVSPVLVGAVPGTALLGVRSAVPEDVALGLARRVLANEITREEAHLAIELLERDLVLGEQEVAQMAAAPEGEPSAEEAQEIDALLAEADGALTRSRR